MGAGLGRSKVLFRAVPPRRPETLTGSVCGAASPAGRTARKDLRALAFGRLQRVRKSGLGHFIDHQRAIFTGHVGHDWRSDCVLTSHFEIPFSVLCGAQFLSWRLCSGKR